MEAKLKIKTIKDNYQLNLKIMKNSFEHLGLCNLSLKYHGLNEEIFAIEKLELKKELEEFSRQCLDLAQNL